jgi:predicted kinase
VRAKVAALRADQVAGEQQIAAAGQARQHLALADQYAGPRLTPLVIAVGGLAGTGKTTLASAAAEALGAEVLRTDVVRKELFGDGPRAAGVDGGIYERQAREQVYRELHRRAALLAAERVSVVLDGTYAALDQLRGAEQLATAAGAAFLAARCTCRPEVARERIARRLAAGTDASDAHPDLHEVQRQRWEPWPANVRQVRVDTEAPLERQLGQVLGALRPTA